MKLSQSHLFYLSKLDCFSSKLTVMMETSSELKFESVQVGDY